jgi:ketopantoate reductase
MDAVSDYRRIIRRLIEGYAQVRPSIGDIEIETIFDESNDHYELIYSGWDRHRRIHGPVVHVDIRGGKVWIQHDGTYHGIANDLVEAGVPKDRIVLAFKPPDVRPHTDFATA